MSSSSESDSETPDRPRKRLRRGRATSGSSHSSNSSAESLGDGALAASLALGSSSSNSTSLPAQRVPTFAQSNRRENNPDTVGEDDEDDEGAEEEIDGSRRRRLRTKRRGDSSDNEGDRDNPASDEDSQDGEDLEESAQRDYRAIAELDRYDTAALDDSEYESISFEARRAAEAALAERDQTHLRSLLRLPAMLQDDSDDSDDDSEDEGRARRRRLAYERAGAIPLGSTEEGEQGEEEGEKEPPEPIDLQNLNAPIGEVIGREAVRAEIQRRFETFLRTYQENGEEPFYKERITAMCSSNSQSLVVSYKHLSRAIPTVAVWLADAPKAVLPLLDQVALQVTLDLFPNYLAIHQDVYVRVDELSIEDTLRELRTMHLGQLVKVSGIVTRRSQVLPQLKLVQYQCKSCGESVGTIEVVDEEKIPAPPECETCEEGGKVVPQLENSIYRNFQRILLQEAPGNVPPCRVPRHKTVILTCDLIDSARPGEEIEVTGVYLNQMNRALNNQHGFPVFTTCIEANYVRKKEDLGESLLITEQDKKEFQRMAKDPRIVERVISSVAPSIYGNRHVKTALALSMFGGRAKNVKGKHNIRGDINVLLMGDPGTAKSQCLKYVEKTAPRAVYTSGKGSSAVGLTAAVAKDPISKEWVLEGGALVLADRGVCIIDEFDKMNDGDRVSIHEAMEQQSISISKAGIVTTLQARCSVVAAANPIAGRYDPQKDFSSQVNLTDPIIQRFDVLCVLQDRVDPMADERLAKFVVSSHVSSHPEGCLSTEEAQLLEQQRLENPASQEHSELTHRNINTYATWAAGEVCREGTIDQEMLKKYILYARTLKPQLDHIDHNKIENLYVEMRRESMNAGGIPIAVRHMESILRMSEAFARMQLREFVRNDDVDRAIQVMLESFISAQKFSVKRQLTRSFSRYVIERKDHNELLMFCLEELLQQTQQFMAPNDATIQITQAEFESRARGLGIHDCTHFYKSDIFLQRGFRLEEALNPARPQALSRLIVKHFTTANSAA